ncbi:MAG TPA: coenzyme F420-0:L-glutamate ligase [Candidatus Binatia bacterium]|nr:coenzyme F420-0:L-glutamate ligase [Candidatus Binatia bacterium]
MPIQLIPLEGIPAIRPGDDLVALLAAAARRSGVESRDLLVVCQKAVSKSEGRVVDLARVHASAIAEQIGREIEKDPRIVEVILGETRRIVRMDQKHLIVETRQGLVCANAGVDESNSLDASTVILLPEDPDASARRLYAELRDRESLDLPVLVTDTFGRPWREGLVEMAIGIAGFLPLLDFRGKRDLAGRELHHTVVAVADELAAAAGLLMDKNRGIPAVLVRGYPYQRGEGRATELLRERSKDLFR